jgi:hypothetical protein
VAGLRLSDVRVGQNLPYFLRTTARDGDLGSPFQRLLAGGHVDDREPANDLLSLGVRAVGDSAVGGYDARPLAFQSGAENPYAGVLGSLDYLERGFGHVGKISLGEVHRAVRERDQVPASSMAPCPSDPSGRLSAQLRTSRSGSDTLSERISHGTSAVRPGGRPVALCSRGHRRARRQLRGFARGFPRALPQLVAAACQVGDLRGVARQLDGFVVGRARLLAAAQPAQQVGAGRVVGVIAGQLVLKTVDGRQCHLRAVNLGDRDGPVEGDDRRGVEAGELVVEGDDLRPVG